MTGTGLGAVVAYLWFPYLALLVAGAAVAVLAGASLIAVLGRGREWHRQDVLIRKLWAAVSGFRPATCWPILIPASC